MNPEEAKTILLLYRPNSTDAGDPQIAEALALATRDPGLARWFADHCAWQEALRAKFRQINVPAGLKEQIISERSAQEKNVFRRQHLMFVAAVAVAALVVLAPLWFQHRGQENAGLASWRNRMAGVALRGYGMDLATNNPAAVRAYLAQRKAPADYVLPVQLEKTTVAGCAIQDWQGAKVSMICFRTGKPLPPGEQSDLWLFVMDRSQLKNAPPTNSRQFVQVSRLQMVTWTEGDKLYLLGTEGDEQTLRRYL